MRKSIHAAVLFYVLIGLVSCKKPAGEFGTSSISGKVFKADVNAVETLVFDGAEERVYLIYGEDDNVYDDWMRCSYDGSFKFEGLSKGNYTLFVYSECEDCESGTEVVKVPVTITKNKQEVIVEDIYTYNY